MGLIAKRRVRPRDKLATGMKSRMNSITSSDRIVPPLTGAVSRDEVIPSGETVAAATKGAGGGTEAGPLPTPPLVRVAIPLDIQSVKQADLDSAVTWRAVTRQALLFYLEQGYGIVGFQRDETTGRGYYYLSIEDEPDHAV